jgi:hypothetical protein
MTINKIELTAYPTATSGGNSWDAFPDSGPDVFVTVNSGTSSNQFSFVSGDVFSDVNGTLLTYTSGLPYTLSSLYSSYTVAAWDDDGSVNTNDHMGGVYFEPSSRLHTRPEIINLTGPNISARLYVTWNY